MSTQFYKISESRSVLFARAISPQLAARRFAQRQVVVLASSHDDLRILAARRNKGLQLSGLPLTWQAAIVTPPTLCLT
jgi:hypothetical protein